MTDKQQVILTGIKPSGMPHLGNYCGAIKPMVNSVNNKKDNQTIYMFIPDIHVINGGLEPAKIREYSYGMLATYLACGLDPAKVVIYRQSAVRQHAELATLLNNFTPKGMMNRAHSYKAAVDKNLDFALEFKTLIEKSTKSFSSPKTTNNLAETIENISSIFIKKLHNTILELESTESANKFIRETKFMKDKTEFIVSILHNIKTKEDAEASRELFFNNLNQLKIDLNNVIEIAKKYLSEESIKDKNINMGLYNYPILMAADILLYHTNTVPVGKDQIQHIEMARDIASSFNHRYSETFTLPTYESKEDAPEISGLDGRKMSKSYGNHIPMFCNENELKSLVKKIITDSAKPEEPKDVEGSTLVQLYALFADDTKTLDFKTRLAAGGLGYGDAKMELFELINSELSEKRAKYNELMADRKALDAILREGEEKARRVAEKTMRKVRKKMGLVDVI